MNEATTSGFATLNDEAGKIIEFCSSFATPGTADRKIVVLRVNVFTLNVRKQTPQKSAIDSIEQQQAPPGGDRWSLVSGDRWSLVSGHRGSRGTIEIPGEIKLNAPESSDSLRSRKERKPLYCNVKLSSTGQPDRILGKDSSENIQWLIDKFCSDVQETVHLGIILTSFESKVSCFRDGLLKKKSGKCNKYLKAQKASPRCGALQT
ncbi:hypothetical protein F2Q68_00031409 [Brassica cretica]|uniref:Uncharacterized protein n=1 Tax=Brassica cretica TaxID=69181 RepID=A0A8S9GCN6_BRACR|nr:hypothetical protein F2Q68_00031409 [Brassica cretica]